MYINMLEAILVSEIIIFNTAAVLFIIKKLSRHIYSELPFVFCYDSDEMVNLRLKRKDVYYKTFSNLYNMYSDQNNTETHYGNMEITQIYIGPYMLVSPYSKTIYSYNRNWIEQQTKAALSREYLDTLKEDKYRNITTVLICYKYEYDNGMAVLYLKDYWGQLMTEPFEIEECEVLKMIGRLLIVNMDIVNLTPDRLRAKCNSIVRSIFREDMKDNDLEYEIKYDYEPVFHIKDGVAKRISNVMLRDVGTDKEKEKYAEEIRIHEWYGNDNDAILRYAPYYSELKPDKKTVVKYCDMYELRDYLACNTTTDGKLMAESYGVDINITECMYGIKYQYAYLVGRCVSSGPDTGSQRIQVLTVSGSKITSEILFDNESKGLHKAVEFDKLSYICMMKPIDNVISGASVIFKACVINEEIYKKLMVCESKPDIKCIDGIVYDNEYNLQKKCDASDIYDPITNTRIFMMFPPREGEGTSTANMESLIKCYKDNIAELCKSEKILIKRNTVSEMVEIYKMDYIEKESRKAAIDSYIKLEKPSPPEFIKKCSWDGKIRERKGHKYIYMDKDYNEMDISEEQETELNHYMDVLKKYDEKLEDILNAHTNRSG